MGGRGGSSGLISEPRGRAMSMKRFLENLEKNRIEGMLNALKGATLKISDAEFTKNGNAVEYQEAVLENESDRIVVRFWNRWEPTQVTKPNSPIRQTIDIVAYKNGNATAIRTLVEKKSTSLKNAEKNYREVLEEWKKLTKQKSIRFR